MPIFISEGRRSRSPNVKNFKKMRHLTYVMDNVLACKAQPPLSSNRQHSEINDCLEDSIEDC